MVGISLLTVEPTYSYTPGMYETPSDYDKPIRPRSCKGLNYLYFCDSKHPLSRGGGMVYHHRHVASVKIGRWLSSAEHVHHKDGNPRNNDPDNLEVLTAATHNRAHSFVEDVECPVCYKSFHPWHNTALYCSVPCYRQSTRRFNISKEDLKRLIWSKPTTAVAKELGVSDSAISKRCKALGISKPPRGHWSKKR